MNMINDLTGNAQKFATACYENSVDELKAALVNGVEETDCNEWNISADEWKEAVQAALNEKLSENE